MENNIKFIKRDTSFVINIIKNIEAKIKRNINVIEENLIIKYAQNISNTIFQTTDINSIITKITNMVIDDIHKKDIINNTPENLHEIFLDRIDPLKESESNQKKIDDKNVKMNIESIYGFNLENLLKYIHKPVLNYHEYILLDSRYRSLDNDGSSNYSWTHINNFLRSQGTINSIGEIKNIKSITILPYRIPYHKTAITLYNRISLSIEEFFTQSIIAHEQKTFHFIGRPTVDNIINPRWIDIETDEFAKGKIKFNKPITTLDTITLNFGSPLEKIYFDKDRLDGKLSFGNPTIILFDEHHNLNNAEIVYISNFNTISNTTLLSLLNSTIGHSCTVINDFSISIPVDSSSLIPTPFGSINSPFVHYSSINTTITISDGGNNIIGNNTTFTTLFIPGDYIQILNNNSNPFFKVIDIISDTELIIDKNYTYMFGTFYFNKTSNIVNGSLDISLVNVDDSININNDTNAYIISEIIESNNSIILNRPFITTNTNNIMLDCSKNNILNQSCNVYFGSKRIFITMIIKYNP